MEGEEGEVLQGGVVVGVLLKIGDGIKLAR